MAACTAAPMNSLRIAGLGGPAPRTSRSRATAAVYVQAALYLACCLTACAGRLCLGCEVGRLAQPGH